jgi:pilus assembly protein Flp/PilA
MKLVQFIKNFAREDDGVTAIEYGLIAALIAVTIIVATTAVGDNLVLVFEEISTELAGAL